MTADGSSLLLSQGAPLTWLPTPNYTECGYALLMPPCNSSSGTECSRPFALGRPVPCDLSSKAFSRFSLPPADIRACLQYDTGYGAPYGWIYAGDSSGALWRWQDGSGGNTVPPALDV